MPLSLFFRLMSLLLLFLFINGLFSASALEPEQMRFELIHRHSSHELSSAKTQSERMKELIHSDNHRVHMISHRLGKRRRAWQVESSISAAKFSINSGAYTGTGQYFVHFQLGSPSQKFLLVADTGSDLTWMNCRYRCHNCTERIQQRRFFNADHSSSFQTISCSTEMCKNLPFSLTRCSSPINPCEYDYKYHDGSTARGVFANETVTLNLANGQKVQLHVVIGCSSSIDGPSFVASDGVLGLGYSNNSFVAKAVEKFSGKFSYCLVDHLSPGNVSSYLTFGNNNEVGMQYTQLVLNVLHGFYPVNVAGISIGGVMLGIPAEIWDVKGEGGVIIDSGTSLTIFPEPAYILIMDALKTPLSNFTKQVQSKPFDFCFSSIGFKESLVPKLVIHFKDSACFEPPVKSYVIDVSDGVKCLGFMANSWPDVSIIGNIMQQNFKWEFDTVNNRLGFAPSSCVTH